MTLIRPKINDWSKPLTYVPGGGAGSDPLPPRNKMICRQCGEKVEGIHCEKCKEASK